MEKRRVSDEEILGAIKRAWVHNYDLSAREFAQLISDVLSTPDVKLVPLERVIGLIREERRKRHEQQLNTKKSGG